jgi:putative restriction endonuclease
MCWATKVELINMRGIVAVTDYGWYEFLRDRNLPEVNFCKPSARRAVHAPPFSPFFFKLNVRHNNAVCGFGYFTRWASLPDWLAWDCFREGNGFSSLAELRRWIQESRQRIRYSEADTVNNIGCTVIVQPTFFRPGEWVPQPEDWHPRIVSSKAYDLTRGEGRRLWDACRERAAIPPELPAHQVPGPAPSRERYGTSQLVAPRLGQGAFRVAVIEAYGRACAVTGEHSLPALDAAHIRDYAQEGPHEVRNGILLRADLHRLFDKGYLTVTPKQRLEVSRRLREDYSNGRSYYPLDGLAVRVPDAKSEQPDSEYLRWHNEHVYLG